MNKLITLFILLILTHIYCRSAEASLPPHQGPTKQSLAAMVKKDLQRQITIAVIDTGIDIRHPDLQKNLWVNQGEVGLDKRGNDKANNNIDDDGNGFIDDVHGWDFTKNSNDLTDQVGHGTHISGIISGKSHPRIINRDDQVSIKIMTLKYFNKDASDEENMKNTAQAIHYAIQMKADLINYSSSGAVKSLKEEEAIQEAAKKGIYFITAAGNSGVNIDKKDYYPANYKINNILAVSATDENFRRIRSSNYGLQAAPAPGKSILSTLPGGAYGRMTGTSQATAYVSQQVATILASQQEANIKSNILNIVKHDFQNNLGSLFAN